MFFNCLILVPGLQKHLNWCHVCLACLPTEELQPWWPQYSVRALAMRVSWGIVNAPVLAQARILIQGSHMILGVLKKVCNYLLYIVFYSVSLLIVLFLPSIIIAGLGGLVVMCSPRDPRFSRSNQTGRWIFSGHKNPGHKSSGRNFESCVPSQRFQAHYKISSLKKIDLWDKINLYIYVLVIP